MGRAGLPFFVISYPFPHSALRDVRLGWVEGWDDDSATFLIAFGEEPRALLAPGDDQEPFAMIDRCPRKTREVAARVGQQRFKFRVLQRYGARCAACGVDVADLLDTAHLVPVSAGGSDDRRNGLVLRPTHHRAFDAGLFAIEPGSLVLSFREGGPDAERLGVSRPSIGHLVRPPHPDALAWLWGNWKGG